MQYFANKGIHAIVDGQFGSTGKGLLASWLAARAHEQGITFFGAISNAGPNSGHTFYHNGEKHVLKQLPTTSVKMALLGAKCPAYLSAGAIIEPAILYAEAARYPRVEIWVHRQAAVITQDDKNSEMDVGKTIARVAGTRSGTGAALARKIERVPDAVWGDREEWDTNCPPNVHTYGDEARLIFENFRYFLEVSQGFSLGLNSNFYPKVTSRECTVMQGLSDARLPYDSIGKVYMVARTFPIRVGNVDGFDSGGWYPDQQELSWDNFPGIEPERTTVTNRVRRIATFSNQQMIASITANSPDFVLWNFMNYLEQKVGALERDHDAFIRRIGGIHAKVPHHFESLWGYGPNDDDVIAPL